MTLRDLSELEIADLRRIARNSSLEYFSTRHVDKSPESSFLAGFNAGTKATLGIVQKTKQNKKEIS